MLDSTLELFTLAASNSLAVFCFCNLIIGIILVSGSSKSNETSPFPSIFSYENLKKNAVSSSNESIKVKKGDDEEEDQLSSVDTADESGTFLITSNDEIFKKNAAPSSEKANELMKSEEEEEEEEEDDDGELRKRIEEFIEKINMGWRDEKLKNSLNYC